MFDLLTLEKKERYVLLGLRAKPKYIWSQFLYDTNGFRIYRFFEKNRSNYSYYCEQENLLSFLSECQLFYEPAQENLCVIIADSISSILNPRKLALANNSWRFNFYRYSFQDNPSAISKALSGSSKLFLMPLTLISTSNYQQLLELLRRLFVEMDYDDKALVSFELQKDPRIALKPCNDAKGHVAAFHLNALIRLNKEFGMNFRLEEYEYSPVYDLSKHVLQNNLISLKDQVVHSDKFDIQIPFSKWERITTQKLKFYTDESITKILRSNGFEIIKRYGDMRGYISSVLIKNN